MLKLYEKETLMRKIGAPILISLLILSAMTFLGCRKSALDVYKENVKKNPNSPKAYNDLAYYLTELKRFEEALDAYDKSLRLRPGDFLATNNKGQVLYEMGRYKEALETFNSLLPKFDNNTILHNNVAMCLHKLGKFDEAYLEYKKSLDLKPNNPYALKGFAILEEDMKKAGKPFPPKEQAGETPAAPKPKK
jgi:tetratricopeptide (TPR) repeat protein